MGRHWRTPLPSRRMGPVSQKMSHNKENRKVNVVFYPQPSCRDRMGNSATVTCRGTDGAKWVIYIYAEISLILALSGVIKKQRLSLSAKMSAKYIFRQRNRSK